MFPAAVLFQIGLRLYLLCECPYSIASLSKLIADPYDFNPVSSSNSGIDF